MDLARKQAEQGQGQQLAAPQTPMLPSVAVAPQMAATPQYNTSYRAQPMLPLNV
jgi:hypothetical protein